MRRLAQLYRDPHAQWVAEELNKADATHDTAGWLNLVWYDPAVRPCRPPISHAPPLRGPGNCFGADPAGAAPNRWWCLKCGLPEGHAAKAKFSTDPGVGHAHPDANHFIVCGAGEWLIRDDGYADKFDFQHNTLLVDGRGNWARAGSG